MPRKANVGQYISVAPARERGLKSNLEVRAEPFRAVAPARERGLKCYIKQQTVSLKDGRSREGARIEIDSP